MSFLHLSTGILDHSSFANCSGSFRFEGCLLPTAVLRSLHRCSMGFRSGLIAGHIRTLQRFVCNHFWSVFWVIVLLEDPWPLMEMQLSDIGHCVAPQNYLVIIRFHDTVHTVKTFSTRSSKATPKHLWTTPMFDCRDCVLFFFCKQCHDVLYQKALLLSRLSTVRSPRRIVVLSHKFWQTPVLLFYAFVSAVVSSWVSYHSVPFHSDGDG